MNTAQKQATVAVAMVLLTIALITMLAFVPKTTVIDTRSTVSVGYTPDTAKQAGHLDKVTVAKSTGTVAK